MTENKSSTSQENTETQDVFMELSVSHMQQIIKLMDTGNKEELKGIVIKMGATWCGPCKKISPLCISCLKRMPDNIICFDIDIDDNMELYSFFKNKRMVNGVPAILCFTINKDRDPTKWYIPDNSVLCADPEQIVKLFQTVFNS